VRLGVVADVHANLPALEAALAALSGVDALVCAGDLVGYGAQPNECVALLREAGARCVMGNHDLMALGDDDHGVTDELVLTTMAYTRRALDDRGRAFLAQLPAGLELGDDVVVAHGAPGDPWHYVRAPGDAAAQLARIPPSARVLLVGHTHRPLAVDDAARTAEPTEVALGDARWLLNPGAVGQSRERELHARALELDLAAGSARFHVVTYDVERARAALRAAGLPEEALHRYSPRWRRALRRALRPGPSRGGAPHAPRPS
jgi:diadenosine tetraphosphatase ApaH/serine/threonine PP2A family protein phosphatase